MTPDQFRRSPSADARVGPAVALAPGLGACLASLARELAHRVDQAEAELPGLAGEPLDAAREAALALVVRASTVARMVEARWLADRARPELALATLEEPHHREPGEEP